MIAQLTTYLGEQVRGLTNGERGEGAEDIDAVRASIASTLARAGKPERGLVTTLAKEAAINDDMPYTERVALLDAMLAAGDTGTVPQERYADLLASVRLDGDQASVEAPESWYDSWFSYRGTGSVTATADLLGLLSKIDPKSPLISQLSRWLLDRRVNGTWGDTYTNGSVLHAFTEVARNAEKVRPELVASLTAGAATLTQNFGPTSLDVARSTSPLSALGTAPLSLAVKATGKGTLHWAALLRYATPAESLKARSQGFSVERSYFPYKGSNSINGVPSTTFKAGDLVTVELLVTTPDRRANVVVDDALPAGFEALDVSLVSTATGSTEGTSEGEGVVTDFPDGVMPAASAGIDHTEVRDDRVLLFATQLESGTFRYTYTARATAPGRFVAAPVQAEEMYRSQVYGRSAPTVVTVTAPAAK
jgi:alpha-2-macroglobulin